MRDKTQRRIIVLSACDGSAGPAVAAKQLRISVRIARDFADAVAAYSRLSKAQAPKVELAELKTWQETTQQAEPASLVLVFPLAAKSTHACVPSKAIESIVKSLPCPTGPLYTLSPIAIRARRRPSIMHSPHCSMASSRWVPSGEARYSLAAPRPSSACTVSHALALIVALSRRRSTCSCVPRVWASLSKRQCAPLGMQTPAASFARSRDFSRFFAFTKQFGIDSER